MTLTSDPVDAPPFDERFTRLFGEQHPRIFRYIDRISGDPELAADIVQETFARLHRRRSVPDRPAAWLITVALNLFRNARSTRSRRHKLLTTERATRVHSDPAVGPAHQASRAEEADRVRSVLDALDERDRALLLLRAEGYAYRDIAAALGIKEASVGTLLARARRTFRDVYRKAAHAY